MNEEESSNIKQLEKKMKEAEDNKKSITLTPMEIGIINIWLEKGKEYKRKYKEAKIIYNADHNDRKEKRARQAIEHIELNIEEKKEKEIQNKKILSEYISLINEFEMNKEDAIKYLTAKYKMQSRESTIKRIQREKQEKINEGMPKKVFEGLLPPNWPNTLTS